MYRKIFNFIVNKRLEVVFCAFSLSFLRKKKKKVSFFNVYLMVGFF